uniref:Nodule-specific cysteine-rich peptide 144 n=3 Tax=Medicago truncatula TaxID=3880 RepID=A7KHA1_MEDTR|nr:nodule-specific cysteine-rich peptide 144 [Medicago truncatula]
MQRRKKSMAKMLKFFFAIILLLSLFLVATEVGGAYIECEVDDDCPKPMKNSHPDTYYKCVKHRCQWAWK